MKNYVILLFAFLSFSNFKAEANPTVYYGAFASDLPGFETDAGKAVAIKNTFKAWGGTWSAFSSSTMDGIRSHGSLPMVTWEPWVAGGGVNQSNYTLQSITNGSHDAYIIQFAQASKAWGHPFFIRLAHEMNGNWYPWCQGVNGNGVGSYIAAWRHIYTIFKQQGVTNVTWAWIPNVIYSGSTDLSLLYPGDAYVDWVGFDVYNMNSGNFRSFKTLSKPTYDKLAAVAASKPIMVGETSSVESGGSKAQWITDAMNSLLIFQTSKPFYGLMKIKNPIGKSNLRLRHKLLSDWELALLSLQVILSQTITSHQFLLSIQHHLRQCRQFPAI